MNNGSLLVLLLSIFLLVEAQTTVQGVLGVRTNVVANTQTTIHFGLLGTPPSLTITVSSNAQVTLALYASIGVNFPNGFTSLSLDAGLGYTLSVSNGSAVVSAQLVTPALSVVSQAFAAAAFRVSCLQFNAETNSFQEVALNSFNILTGFNITIPEAGIYVFAAVRVNATIPNFYGRARKLIQNAQALIQYSENFFLDVTASATADVTVTLYNNNPAPKNAPSTFVTLNFFWTIDLNAQANINSTLTFVYTAAQLAAAGVNATQLRFAFYNTVTAQWEFLNTGGRVDVTTKTITQFTTHFSTWGVFGDNTTPTQQQSATQALPSSANSGAIFAPCVSLVLLLFHYLF